MGVGTRAARQSVSPAGLCVTLQSVDPESGSIIRDVEGAQNISLFCEAFNEGSPVQTAWFQQTPDDIEAGRDSSIIPNDDENFIRSGGSVVEMGITVQLNTNLTIVTLTAELDKVIIYCGTAVDLSSLANFTLRVYRKSQSCTRVSSHVVVVIIVVFVVILLLYSHSLLRMMEGVVVKS